MGEELASQILAAYRKRSFVSPSGSADMARLRNDDFVSYCAAKILLNNRLYVRDDDAHLPPCSRKVYCGSSVVLSGSQSSRSALSSLAGEYVPPRDAWAVLALVVAGCPTLSDEALWVAPGLLWAK